MRPSVQRRRPESTGARTRRKSIYGPVTEAVYYLSAIIMCVGLAMQSLEQGKTSCMGRIGYMAADIGCFVNAVVFCSIITPRHVIWLKARYGRICIPIFWDLQPFTEEEVCWATKDGVLTRVGNDMIRMIPTPTKAPTLVYPSQSY
ncbi:hypothetical protein EJB05_51495, partial [Eragrostis curvula]